MKYRLRCQGYSAENGRLTQVALRFSDCKLENPRAMATSSLVGWGAWQESEKVPCSLGDCWWVSTAGHGGYVLVTQTKYHGDDSLVRFKKPTFKVEHDASEVWRDIPELYVYAYEFEEDCDWAILEYQDPQVLQWALASSNKRRMELGEPERTVADYVESIRATLRMYNPWLLETPKAVVA